MANYISNNNEYSPSLYSFFSYPNFSVTQSMPNFSQVPLFSVKNSKYVVDYSKGTNKIDGNIDSFRQTQYDCWLLSAVWAISNNPDGKKLIKNSIKDFPKDRKVMVNLVGANQMISVPYEVIEAAKQSKNYVKGDDDTLVIELAVEHYKKQLLNSGDFNKKISNNIINGKNVVGDVNNPLAGGMAADMMFLLSGKVPQIISNTKENDVQKIKAAVEKMQQNPDSYVATCNFKQKKDGLFLNHAYAIKSVDDKYITIVNPHDTSKEKTMLLSDFYDNVKTITVLNLKTVF